MSLGLTRHDATLFWVIVALVVLAPILLNPFPVDSEFARFNAGYPDLIQRFVIFGIFAVGFNILFGLTGYLSFGHAAFLGVGSYAGVWAMKLLTVNVLPAILLSVVVAGLFSLLIGFICLRRSGIYFSILTLAFAQMSFALAYSVLTPITAGETGLQLSLADPRVLEPANDSGTIPAANLFGVDMRESLELVIGAAPGTGNLTGWVFTFNFGYYLCAIFMVVAFYISVRLFRSPFGMMLRAVKSNQQRMLYTGLNPRPYTLAAFVISGMYAGLAGGLMVAMDPLAGADRMFWTASGEVVLMTILGGAGTLQGPLFGAGIIKYFENIFSRVSEADLAALFSGLPDGLASALTTMAQLFVGDGWLLTLGIMFMLVVIFLPGGLVEGAQRLVGLFRGRLGHRTRSGAPSGGSATGQPDPAAPPATHGVTPATVRLGAPAGATVTAD